VKQFTAALFRPWKDAPVRRRHLVVTFENVVTTTVFVGWLWMVLLAAKKALDGVTGRKKSTAAAEKGFEAGTPISPETHATVQRSGVGLS